MKPFGLAWEGFGEAVGEAPGAALGGGGERGRGHRSQGEWVSGSEAENGDSQGPVHEGGGGSCNHCFYFQKPIGNHRAMCSPRALGKKK